MTDATAKPDHGPRPKFLDDKLVLDHHDLLELAGQLNAYITMHRSVGSLELIPASIAFDFPAVGETSMGGELDKDIALAAITQQRARMGDHLFEVFHLQIVDSDRDKACREVELKKARAHMEGAGGLEFELRTEGHGGGHEP